LQSLGLEDGYIKEINKIGYHTFIKNHADKIIIRNEKLGESFSNKKRRKLFGKMIRQLDINNTQAVKRLIRKGAYIDREFYKLPEESLNSPSLWISRPELERFLARIRFKTNSNLFSNFYSYTPLAMAAEKGNQTLAKFILKAKNGDDSSDKKQNIHYLLI